MVSNLSPQYRLSTPEYNRRRRYFKVGSPTPWSLRGFCTVLLVTGNSDFRIRQPDDGFLVWGLTDKSTERAFEEDTGSVRMTWFGVVRGSHRRWLRKSVRLKVSKKLRV